MCSELKRQRGFPTALIPADHVNLTISESAAHRLRQFRVWRASAFLGSQIPKLIKTTALFDDLREGSNVFFIFVRNFG